MPKSRKTRTKLSCTSCRERKVKCNRVNPCENCCIAGAPRECVFEVAKGNDYAPITQAQSIRALERENKKLREHKEHLEDIGRLQEDKERLERENLQLRHKINQLESPSPPNPKSSLPPDVGTEHSVRRGEMRPDCSAGLVNTRRTGADEPDEGADIVRFRTPAWTDVPSAFLDSESPACFLTHETPQRLDAPAPDERACPFPMLTIGDNTSTALLQLLPDHGDIYDTLNRLKSQWHCVFFPPLPCDSCNVTEEVAGFLGNAKHNAMISPHMLAFIFATLATGTQMTAYGPSEQSYEQETIQDLRQKSDCYATASMQALRNGSFTSQPTLLCIQTLTVLGSYLTNSGRERDAWTLFGSTIRLAHLVALHRNPLVLIPEQSLQEGQWRQRLWWWMLQMDSHHSVMLARPLGISSLGDCPAPTPINNDPTLLQLGSFAANFTVITRQILGTDDISSGVRIDEFTGRLVGLWNTMPKALRLDNRGWSIQEETAQVGWYLEVTSAIYYAKIQYFIMRLHSLGIRHSAISDYQHWLPVRKGARCASPDLPGTDSPSHLLPALPVEQHAPLIESCTCLLKAFLFLKNRYPTVMLCPSLDRQAFSAALMFVSYAEDPEVEKNEMVLNLARKTFVCMKDRRAPGMVGLPVHRLGERLDASVWDRSDRSIGVALKEHPVINNMEAGRARMPYGAVSPRRRR